MINSRLFKQSICEVYVAIRFFRAAFFSVALLTAACGKTEKLTEAASEQTSPPATVETSEAPKSPELVEAPAPDPILDAKVSIQLGYLSSIESELKDYRTAIDEGMQKDSSVDFSKEIESLAALKVKHAEAMAALEPMVLENTFFESEKVTKKIGADHLYACGQQIVAKLRALRGELESAKILAFPPTTEPDFLDNLLNEDPAIAQQRRKEGFTSHMMMAEEMLLDIKGLVEKQKLQKKMYFAPAAGEKKQVSLQALLEMSHADDSWSPHYFIKHELEISLSDSFLKSLGAPNFLKKSGEYAAASSNAKAWKGRIEVLKSLLKIEKSLSDVSSLADLND